MPPKKWLPKSGADKVRAHRVRAAAARGPVSDDDAAFLESYQAPLDAASVADGAAAANASASASRTVHIEERAATAQGNHVHPDAYAAIARSEGLRADTLLRVSADAMIRVNQQAFALVELCYARLEAVETAHVGMMNAVRDHYLARTEAEANQIRLQEMAQLGDGENGEFMQFMGFMQEAWKHQRENGNGNGGRAKRKKKKKEPLGSP